MVAMEGRTGAAAGDRSEVSWVDVSQSWCIARAPPRSQSSTHDLTVEILDVTWPNNVDRFRFRNQV
jgi:hypothetical protein